LHDVRRLSTGVFKPSAVGAYERGERQISLERFHLLAEIYKVSAAQLLAEVAVVSSATRVSPGSVVIHLDRLSGLEQGMLTPITEFVDGILTKRGDSATRRIVLRAADVDELASRLGRPKADLTSAFNSALEVN
jgi:transcriptional regulator with XRE-family HTH domain